MSDLLLSRRASLQWLGGAAMASAMRWVFPNIDS